jgi:hypothetical protein
MSIKKPGMGPVDEKGMPTAATVPSFSYAPNDNLAQLIVQAWTIQSLRDQLLDRDAASKPTAVAVKAATDAVNAAGFNLKRAVVITEKEHDADYTMGDAITEVVFVLPDPARLGTGFVPGQSLLETARLLMACTPNGI